MKILNTFGKHFAPEAQAILATLGEAEYRQVTHGELLECIGEYDILVVGILPMVDTAILDAATKLKYIAIPANTLENIDVAYAESKGITVVSLWGEEKILGSITGTAELAFGLMIDIVRKTPWAFDDVKQYQWDREKFRGKNLSGKTLGIVGIGRLGTWMAHYAKAFGMHVIFYSPHTEKSPTPECRKVSFEELLKESDIISLHAHLNAETERMFGAEEFKKMKQEAYLINTARGKIVDEAALLAALLAGEIAGYAADVLADEFEFDQTGLARHPLIDYAKQHQNVIIVPHIGGMTVESRELTDVFVAKKLRDAITKQS